MDGAFLGHARAAGRWPQACALTLKALFRRLLICENLHLAVAGGGDRDRDMGHSRPAAPGSWGGAGCLDDHVGGGLGRRGGRFRAGRLTAVVTMLEWPSICWMTFRSVCEAYW